MGIELFLIYLVGKAPFPAPTPIPFWNEAKDLDSEWPEQDVICTMKFAMDIGGFESYALDKLCERFNIDYQKHRALEDARATGQLFNKLVDLL